MNFVMNEIDISIISLNVFNDKECDIEYKKWWMIIFYILKIVCK